jgi:hypothetical protein
MVTQSQILVLYCTQELLHVLFFAPSMFRRRAFRQVPTLSSSLLLLLLLLLQQLSL